MIALDTSDTVVDTGDEGDSIRDTPVFANDIDDSEDANLIGSEHGSCTRVKPASKKDAVDGLMESSWTVSLATGEHHGAGQVAR